jgi:hypothetical protein
MRAASLAARHFGGAAPSDSARPDKMRVELDPDVGVSAKTVGELRKVTAWPENLVITTPHECYPGSAVKVSKASKAKRATPKP